MIILTTPPLFFGLPPLGMTALIFIFQYLFFILNEALVCLEALFLCFFFLQLASVRSDGDILSFA